MPASAISELRESIGLGLNTVTRVWSYRAKDWVTSVYVADIDNDGIVEVVACSRDGRVYLLTILGADRIEKWERIIGEKAWVGTGVATGFSSEEKITQARIIVGTRDGKVYVLNKDGMTLPKNGNGLPYDSEGKTIDKKAEERASWLDVGYVIRQIYVDPRRPSDIIIGSEDRCVYVLDFTTGALRWKFQTKGWVRAVFSYDIDQDGQSEILVGSVDKHLYMLDHAGQLLAKCNMKFPVHTIFATDVDHDDRVEILVGTDGKDLVALTYDSIGKKFEEKWRRHFDNRLLCLCVTDIDNDGQREIIAGSEDKHFYILDNQGKTIWRHHHKFRVFSIYPYDIDNDGIPELILGSDNNRVRAMRIRLRKGLDKKIRRYYQLLGSPEPASIASLSNEERDLLQDILGGERKEYVTLKQAEELLKAKKYTDTLSVLLRLEQQKVQKLWNRDKIGLIRTVCFRHITSDPRRELIVGTSEGDVLAYTATGRHLWTVHLDDHIIDVQTGYIDHNKLEEIVICSSDHRIYILGGAKKQDQRDAYIDTLMSSISVTAPDRQTPPEIIIGSENKKLYIYKSDLNAPADTIDTPEGIRVVRTSTQNAEHMPEIVAGSLGKRVYAYTRKGELLWHYDTRDHIRSICIKDINGDGKIEVLVGSEDRNVHVLDSAGHLLWRYYLPHYVTSIDAEDADHDGMVEIFAGCADGCLYVFERDGRLLWKYQSSDRVLAVRVEDIDDDGNVEIALGSEDEMELLQVVNQRHMNMLIDQCWFALCQIQPAEQIIEVLLTSPDSFLQSFALRKLAEQDNLSSHDVEVFEKYAKIGSIEVRQTLVRVVLSRYLLLPSKMGQILQMLSLDADGEVRSVFIESLPLLMRHDWDKGFEYLARFSEDENRYIQRLAVRALHESIETATGKKRGIFDLLLAAALNKDSEWVCQEAARSLAHFLDRNQGGLIVYVHLFIVKAIRPAILEHIVHFTKTPVVNKYLIAIMDMLTDLNDENVLQRTRQVAEALEGASALLYAKDIRLIYIELCRLLEIYSVDDFTQYQYSLNASQFAADNEFAQIPLEVFGRLNSISRMLRIYLMRDNANDRLTILLEASEAIEKTSKFLEKQYALPLLGEPLTRLLNRTVFLLILHRWREMVQVQLNVLRGRAEITAELQARYTRFEDQVGIWLHMRNTGRSSAHNVKVTLLHSDNFDVAGTNTFETETILPDEGTNAEFTLNPHKTLLDLVFEIYYDDAQDAMKIVKFGDRLELGESYQEFRYIPNPYSTGTPILESRMFYGREEDMTILKENLTRSAKSVIVLYGQRRSGKTTLLLQLINATISDEYIPVLIDMQRVSYQITIQSFLYKVASYIARAMKKNQLIVCPPDLTNFEKDPTDAFDLFLDSIEDQFVERKLILLIDEFEVLEEQVINGRLQSEVFDYLRDIVQHRQYINFLFSGTHKITEHTKWYRSIFFHIARHHRLSKLSQQGTEDLIQQPVAGYLEYEPLTVKKIHQLTADQPYLIHLICRYIVDYCNEKRKTYVTINDINVVLREVMQTGQFHFDWLWDQISPEEHVALSALAEGGKDEGRWLTLVEIEEIYRHNRIPFKREYLLASLKTLIDADLIESESNATRDMISDSSRYRIAVGLTRMWLRKEKPLEMVRKEMNG